MRVPFLPLQNLQDFPARKRAQSARSLRRPMLGNQAPPTFNPSRPHINRRRRKQHGSGSYLLRVPTLNSSRLSPRSEEELSTKLRVTKIEGSPGKMDVEEYSFGSQSCDSVLLQPGPTSTIPDFTAPHTGLEFTMGVPACKSDPTGRKRKQTPTFGSVRRSVSNGEKAMVAFQQAARKTDALAFLDEQLINALEDKEEFDFAVGDDSNEDPKSSDENEEEEEDDDDLDDFSFSFDENNSSGDTNSFLCNDEDMEDNEGKPTKRRKAMKSFDTSLDFSSVQSMEIGDSIQEDAIRTTSPFGTTNRSTKPRSLSSPMSKSTGALSDLFDFHNPLPESTLPSTPEKPLPVPRFPMMERSNSFGDIRTMFDSKCLEVDSMDDVKKTKPTKSRLSFSQTLPTSTGIGSAPKAKTCGDLTLLTSSAPVLPICQNSRRKFNSGITCTTTARAIRGQFGVKPAEILIVDARYPYEFEGGHIINAINVYQDKDLISMFFGKNQTLAKVIIFHCEFSSERGPHMWKLLRDYDRKLNLRQYPFLNYPNIYLMVGGYKKFFSEFKALCTPCAYVPMLAKGFAREMKKYRVKTRNMMHKSSSALDLSRYRRNG